MEEEGRDGAESERTRGEIRASAAEEELTEQDGAPLF